MGWVGRRGLGEGTGLGCTGGASLAGTRLKHRPTHPNPFNPPLLQVDYESNAVTENTRASYPIEHIDNARIPCVGPHPKNIVLLCCDAFGVLPPVSRLTSEQAMYHFISGYTAKARGEGVRGGGGGGGIWAGAGVARREGGTRGRGGRGLRQLNGGPGPGPLILVTPPWAPSGGGHRGRRDRA